MFGWFKKKHVFISLGTNPDQLRDIANKMEEEQKNVVGAEDVVARVEMPERITVDFCWSYQSQKKVQRMLGK